MAFLIVNLMLKAEYTNIDDIDPEFFISFLAERISEKKFPLNKPRIYKEIRAYIKKRHHGNSNYYGEDWDEDGTYINASLHPKFNFNKLENNDPLDNYSLELIEDRMYEEIKSSIVYSDEVQEATLTSLRFPYIANALAIQKTLSYRSFVTHLIKQISIERLPLNLKIIESEIDLFLEVMNDHDPSTKIELLRYISQQMPPDFRKEKFDIMFNIQQYKDREENTEFSLKLL